MENLKHTREYAEKLAKENVIYGESIGNYVFGYMKAIEETKAPDMLEALIEVKKVINKDFTKGDLIDIDILITNIINKVTNK